MKTYNYQDINYEIDYEASGSYEDIVVEDFWLRNPDDEVDLIDGDSLPMEHQENILSLIKEDIDGTSNRYYDEQYDTNP